MAWVRIDDRFASHPKVLAAGPLAMAMQIAALCYCNRELTDGYVPRSAARTLLDWEIVRADDRIYKIGVSCGMSGDDVGCAWVIGILVESGMWEEVQGGYQVHDYLDYQPSREQVEEERAKTAKRQEEWRAKHRNGATNDQSNGSSNAVTNETGNDVTNRTVTGAPKPKPKPLPVPTPVPVPTDELKPPTVETPQAAKTDREEQKHDPPKPVKPKSPAKIASDLLYERRIVIFDAFLRGLDITPESLAATQRKGPSLQVLTTAILDSPECTPDVIEPLTRYTATAFRWRQGRTTPSLAEVIAALPEWEGAGRPDAAPTPIGRTVPLPPWLQKRVDVHLQECASDHVPAEPYPKDLQLAIDDWRASLRLGAA